MKKAGYGENEPSPHIRRQSRTHGCGLGRAVQSQCVLCLLSNSSKKPLFFVVLKVTFCYLRVEDEQGSSVVEHGRKYSPRRHRAAEVSLREVSFIYSHAGFVCPSALFQNGAHTNVNNLTLIFVFFGFKLTLSRTSVCGSIERSNVAASALNSPSRSSNC
jgi:hypothetical protein